MARSRRNKAINSYMIKQLKKSLQEDLNMPNAELCELVDEMYVINLDKISFDNDEIFKVDKVIKNPSIKELLNSERVEWNQGSAYSTQPQTKE